MKLFIVTYTLPKGGCFIEKGLTHEGVACLMQIILRLGGSGSVMEMV